MKQILIVDDDSLVRTVIATCLRNAGMSVDEVADGSAAITAAHHEKYSLIFMDYYMPEMHGCAAARHIRKSGLSRFAPIIAMTGAEDCTRFFKAGMNAYLKKPLNEDTVVATAQRWLSAGHGLQQAMTPSADGADISDVQRLNLLISTIGRPQVIQLMERFIGEIEKRNVPLPADGPVRRYQCLDRYGTPSRQQCCNIRLLHTGHFMP